jgi:Ras-related protein Rab-40
MSDTNNSTQSPRLPNSKQYDYLLKFLLVGDSDVGKEELLKEMEDGASESPYGYSSSGMYRPRS